MRMLYGATYKIGRMWWGRESCLESGPREFAEKRVGSSKYLDGNLKAEQQRRVSE
jgi:hypothetical protein